MRCPVLASKVGPSFQWRGTPTIVGLTGPFSVPDLIIIAKYLSFLCIIDLYITSSDLT